MKTKNNDIRWLQRFSNFQAALKQLTDGVNLYKERELSLLEKQGIIKAFEFTHELAWNVMKDYFEYQGNFNLKGSRDAVREAFKYNLLKSGNVWMKMIETRNLTSHIYDKEIADEVIKNIVQRYTPEIQKFEKAMEEIKDGNAA